MVRLRKIKGIKQVEATWTFPGTKLFLFVPDAFQQCYQEGLSERGHPYLLQRKHCSVEVMSLSLDGLDSCSIGWLVGYSNIRSLNDWQIDITHNTVEGVMFV